MMMSKNCGLQANRKEIATSTSRVFAGNFQLRQHDPGQYAWQNSAHGERMLGNQRQAIDARMKQFDGQGTVRSASPGTTFTLADHPEHDLDAPEQRKFLITAISHLARNNLDEAVNGEQGREQDSEPGGKPGVDLYRNQITAIRAGIPWRPLSSDSHGRTSTRARPSTAL